MPFALANPRVYYERSGAGEPLLFITGFTISAAVFEPILPRTSRSSTASPMTTADRAAPASPAA